MPQKTPEMLKVIKRAQKSKKFFSALFTDTKKTLDAWLPALSQSDKDKLAGFVQVAVKAHKDIGSYIESQQMGGPIGDPPWPWTGVWTQPDYSGQKK